MAASDEALGWRPHRDHPRLVLVDPDGAPHSLTAWLPLTDATPPSGCIYLLPASVDPDLRRVGGPRDLVRRPQDVRAQPATAGSLLAWNHGLLHPGGRSSRRARAPRISLGCELQRASIAPVRAAALRRRRRAAVRAARVAHRAGHPRLPPHDRARAGGRGARADAAVARV